MLGQRIPVRRGEFVQDINKCILYILCNARSEVLICKLLGELHGSLRSLEIFTAAFDGNQIVDQREESFLYLVNISGNVVNDTIESKQDRHLDNQLYTAAGRGSTILLVDSLGLLVHCHH